MKHLVVVVVVASLLVAAAGCGSPLAPSADLTGTWTEQFSIPGPVFRVVLQQSGTQVSGTGHYSIEAGRSGPLILREPPETPDRHLHALHSLALTASMTRTGAVPLWSS